VPRERIWVGNRSGSSTRYLESGIARQSRRAIILNRLPYDSSQIRSEGKRQHRPIYEGISWPLVRRSGPDGNVMRLCVNARKMEPGMNTVLTCYAMLRECELVSARSFCGPQAYAGVEAWAKFWWFSSDGVMDVRCGADVWRVNASRARLGTANAFPGCTRSGSSGEVMSV